MALDIKLLTVKFAGEATKHCDHIEKELLAMEAGGMSQEGIDSVFRSAHTIKGAARMLKLKNLAAVAHHIEDVLDCLRSRQLRLSQELTDVLLRGVDTVRKLAVEAASGVFFSADTLPPVCAELERFLHSATEAGEQVANMQLTMPEKEPVQKQEAENRQSVLGLGKQENKISDKEVAAKQLTKLQMPVAQAKTVHVNTDYISVCKERLDEVINLIGEMVSFQYKKKRQTDIAGELCRLIVKGLEFMNKAYDNDGNSVDREVSQHVKEIMTSLQGQLHQLSTILVNDAATESLLTGEMQERSLQLRMMPITVVFDKLQRVVRDLGRSTGKEIDFQITGGDTELDRKIIEQLDECLLHLVRNAVDHGVETTAERLQAGKNPRGFLRLSAIYEAGGVTIILQDDGAGISPDSIKKTAVQRGKITQEQANRLTDREILDLIFLPGFSTSPLITDISGRGVGLNVVRQTVTEQMKGSVSLQTKLGEGTTFILKVPATLAISRLLLLQTGGYCFAVPAYAVQEIVLVPASQLIEVVGKQALRSREQIVPLEKLAALIHCPVASALQGDESEHSEVLIVLLVAGAERLGVIVDQVVDEADMVIKPLPALVQQQELLAGFTIGRQDEIVSVLSVNAIVRLAREYKAKTGKRTATAVPQRRKNLLVVDDSANTREIVKSILESYGYQVELAEDGLQAIEKTKEKVYDAIITDVEMPQLDGFSLTLRLRQDERYRQTPVIIVTSREKEEDKRRGIQVGASAYIVKGAFDQNNLIETIQNLIGE